MEIVIDQLPFPPKKILDTPLVIADMRMQRAGNTRPYIQYTTCADIIPTISG